MLKIKNVAKSEKGYFMKLVCSKKSVCRKIAITSLFFCSLGVHAENLFSFGVGIGYSYSGLGVNVSKLAANDIKYFSAGCVSHSTTFGSACGVGIGWITTELLKTPSKKHGLGGYLGIVGSENKINVSSFDNESVYGLGIGYHYFFKGISEPGTNLGFSLVAGEGGENSVMLQLGYQF